MARCDTCKANKVCDHNKYGFENCNNYISADVVEVVRCKDCKYWRDWEMAVVSHGFGPNMGECHCAQWDNEYFYYLTKDTDFCSYGEKEE